MTKLQHVITDTAHSTSQVSGTFDDERNNAVFGPHPEDLGQMSAELSSVGR